MGQETDHSLGEVLRPGSALRDYEIGRVLGRGGFGVVYQGHHLELGSRVAMKEYFPSEVARRIGGTIQPSRSDNKDAYEDGLRRFVDEARRLESFRDCRIIVTFRDLFRANGTAYLVMDFVEGLPLSDLLARREDNGQPFTESDLLSVIRPVLEGLQVIHAAGVYHRDIKPSNILIRRSDSQPVLIDFGAAKQVVSGLTKSLAPYTDGYAAMEQVGEGEIGPWTDLYGLGAVMWRMVAGGSPPWTPPNPLTVQRRAYALMQGQEDPMPPAQQIGAGRFTLNLLQTIDACLAVSHSARLSSCDDLIAALETKAVEPAPTKTQANPNVSPEAHIDNRAGPLPKTARTGVMGYWLRAMGKYAVFRGRASRKEFWMFILVNWSLYFLLLAVYAMVSGYISGFATLYFIATFLPTWSAAVRRLHDADLSGWWLLVPMVNILLLTSPTKTASGKSAAKRGHADAQYRFGRMYEKGRGVSQDDQEAVKWYRRSADQGNASAQHKLGLMYEDGRGVSQDDQEAVKWYRLSADQGDADAQYSLGLWYKQGREWPQDDQEAMKWFRLAAKQGHARAQYLLGRGYVRGTGVPCDYVSGYAWLNLAAAAGVGWASMDRSDLSSKMTADQVAAAQRLSAELSRDQTDALSD